MEYKEQIKNFLEDKENYSLLISGSWGVGKTYLWKEIENELNPKITHKENLWKKFKSNINFFNHLMILISIIEQYVGIILMGIIKYFNLCNYIENLNKIENSNKQEKNIIYVSLFGKEHYKEVLEEITLKAYKYNRFLYFIRNITFWKLSVGTFLQ
ncbi:P-loop NTPase fold protein, partial [Helicobacter pullorum]|uniref:P-loop NTPase fold protein n=1 Tax=Helicobacter pullorum TaxID=35818 RepID=UPI000A9DB9A3